MPYITTLSAPKFIGKPTLVFVHDEVDGQIVRAHDLGTLTKFEAHWDNGTPGQLAVLDGEREYFWPNSRPVVNFHKAGQATAVIGLVI